MPYIYIDTGYCSLAKLCEYNNYREKRIEDSESRYFPLLLLYAIQLRHIIYRAMLGGLDRISRQTQYCTLVIIEADLIAAISVKKLAQVIYSLMN